MTAGGKSRQQAPHAATAPGGSGRERPADAGPAAFDINDANIVWDEGSAEEPHQDQGVAPFTGATPDGAETIGKGAQTPSSRPDDARQGAKQDTTDPDASNANERHPGDAAPIPSTTAPRARRRTIADGAGIWGGIFLSALGAIIALAISLWIGDFIASLMVREGWLGWLALGLFITLCVAAFALAVRELSGIFALRRLKSLRADADRAWRQDDARAARRVVTGLKAVYAGRPDVALALERLARGGLDIAGGREIIGFADRELAAALDAEARRIVSTTAQRVALLTALSPGAVLDIAIVAAQTLGMLRKLAQLYGGRPGFIGLMRLARRVVSHLILTGGIALTLDIAQDLLGKRLAGMVAGKLGEGVFNGALTARLGLAAMDLCRPVPNVVSQAPSVRGIVNEIISGARGG